MAVTITKFKVVGERVGNGLMETGQTVERGMLCAFNTNGRIQQLDDIAGWRFAGIAKHSAGDTDESSTVELDYGSVYFYPYASAVQADVSKPVYASGLGTLAKAVSNGVFAGVIVDVAVGSGWWIDPLASEPQTGAWAQATTGTGANAGEIAITGMTPNGKVLVTLAENPGNNLVLSHIVADNGKITVYSKDVSATPSIAVALEGKKVNYLVLSLS